MSKTFSTGIIGARGHTGGELLRLLSGHPDLEVVYAGSRELAGEPVPHTHDLSFGDLDADGIAELDLDAIFLALPNGLSGPFVESLSEDTVIVDISADHRLDDTWAYGLPELNRDKIAGARRIANPGCYATAAQLSLAPFIGLLDAVPAVFGVSGFSGAGTTPSPKNDPVRLEDNLLPYSLVDHVHERETSKHLGRPVRFMPHVHQAFRGLLTTTHIPVEQSLTQAAAFDRLSAAYADEPLITVQEVIPEMRDGAGSIGVIIGGVAASADGHNVVVVAAEDNLLKGAAVQAIQNLNLGLGLPEFTALV